MYDFIQKTDPANTQAEEHVFKTPSPPPKINLADHLPKTNLTDPMAGVSAIYYINMDRSHDREVHMQSVLADPIFKDIPVERVRGIDGKSEDVFQYLDFYQCTKNPRMMETEYGCTLSHFRAIHQFAMTDEPVGLILEDDVTAEFVPFWSASLGELAERAPPDCEVLQLSYILFETLPEAEYEVWEMRKNFCGTAAYLIKNEAAKRLIQYLCRYSSPAMPKYCLGPEVPYYHHADRFLYCFLKTYSYRCPPFTYRDSNDSVIHPDHMDFHAESKEKTKRQYLRFAAAVPASVPASVPAAVPASVPASVPAAVPASVPLAGAGAGSGEKGTVPP